MFVCLHALKAPEVNVALPVRVLGLGSGYTSAAMGVSPSASSPTLLRNTSDVKVPQFELCCRKLEMLSSAVLCTNWYQFIK